MDSAHADTEQRFFKYGPNFPALLAHTATLSDHEREAFPQSWLDLSALLCTLIEDDGMTTEAAAETAALPAWVVAGYRAEMGI